MDKITVQQAQQAVKQFPAFVPSLQEAKTAFQGLDPQGVEEITKQPQAAETLQAIHTLQQHLPQTLQVIERYNQQRTGSKR